MRPFRWERGRPRPLAPQTCKFHYIDKSSRRRLNACEDHRIAAMIQDVLLGADGESYRLSAWVIMPNHIHMLVTRFANFTLANIMQFLKSITSHKANRILKRRGRFWMPDYFDRYIRNADHFASTIRYIENNPVKARLCMRAEDWPCSSARFRGSKEEGGSKTAAW